MDFEAIKASALDKILQHFFALDSSTFVQFKFDSTGKFAQMLLKFLNFK